MFSASRSYSSRTSCSSGERSSAVCGDRADADVDSVGSMVGLRIQFLWLDVLLLWLFCFFVATAGEECLALEMAELVVRVILQSRRGVEVAAIVEPHPVLRT